MPLHQLEMVNCRYGQYVKINKSNSLQHTTKMRWKYVSHGSCHFRTFLANTPGKKKKATYFPLRDTHLYFRLLYCNFSSWFWFMLWNKGWMLQDMLHLSPTHATNLQCSNLVPSMASMSKLIFIRCGSVLEFHFCLSIVCSQVHTTWWDT